MSQQEAAAVEQLRGIRYALQSLALGNTLDASSASITLTSADVTLSATQATKLYLVTNGTLTANVNVIVPSTWVGFVFNNNTGAFSTTVKTSGGSGVAVAQTKRAILLADGTNVVRITADA